MQRPILMVGAAACALLLSMGSALGAGFASARGGRQNAAGGVTAGARHAVAGENAGAATRRGFATDGQGDGVGGNAEVFKGPNGAEGARAGRWSRSADGSAAHTSGGAYSGANGTLTTHGSASRDSSGNTTASRSTTATSTSGASYDGSTSYQSGSGVSHSGTCTDASGNVVPCPSR